MSDISENADLRALVETCPEGVIVVREGFVVYVNRAFADCLGRTVEQVGDTMFLDLLNEPYREPMAQWLGAGPGEGRDGPSEYGFTHADGRRVMVQLTPMWLASFAGYPARGFIARDVSTVRQTQADLLLADRMMTVGALAAGVAHEINNPMSFVIGNLHYAISVLEQPDFPKEVDLEDLVASMREALDGAQRISQIVKNFHMFSKADNNATTALSLPSVVESALTAAFVQIRRKARLVRDLRPTPPVMSNEARLGQVILNLILNAVQALPDQQSMENTIAIRTYEEAGQAVFQISDTGPGISAPVLSHVFEPFFTTKPIGIGTGLGLSIAHSIVRELGGTIDVESALGQGSTFTVRLPPRPRPVDDDDVDDDDRDTTFIPAESGRILVVDDEALIVSSFKRVLRDVDLAVAHSGREAIQILSRDINFDVIFCDLYMPDVNGMEVHSWVQKTHPGLEDRIVFMTGGAFNALTQDFLARLPNRRLDKPFNPEDIQRMIRGVAD